MTITPALENYLKIILELNEMGGGARVTNISQRFDVTKATVSQTVKRLMKHGLVTKDEGGAIFLTDFGKEKAMEVRNRNLVIKGFLTEVLGLDRQVSEEDACRMEHLISCETVEKLKGYLLKSR
ncbi:metal-dependent transcriptional regulator [Anaerotignum sp. MB30-C6]|uniref:metal-dependent transcriptional regulator n=1 Tax=Anaerotignum sp. MB30-C6 TaxID=3070814 RepID=UPI0027DBD704|nr:metal-dependent transcriptional regulator [Anaerotignum sp. MB30-C6]WMI82702.1 metal-dependent transcriptional regulator [Anaerotignum sp. MB30-C6]